LTLYYYLVASLPLLSLEAERFCSHDEFLEACRQNLSPRDYRVVAAAGGWEAGSGEPSCRALQMWRGWEISLRRELASLRAKRAGREEAGGGPDSPGVIAAQSAARAAFGQASPLEAEEMLDRARWAYLEELEVGHHFDGDVLVIYHVRLQILRRRALREPVAGERQFSESYEAITKGILTR